MESSPHWFSRALVAWVERHQQRIRDWLPLLQAKEMSHTVQHWDGSDADFPLHSFVPQSCASEAPDPPLDMEQKSLKLPSIWYPARAMCLHSSKLIHHKHITLFIRPLPIFIFVSLLHFCFTFACIACVHLFLPYESF